jgi:subtilisin family serine protease
MLHRTPGDPNFGELWGLRNTGQSVQGTCGKTDADIEAASAWDVSTGESDVVVAVLDSGVFYDHEDLSQNMWQNAGELLGNNIDDDDNGYVDDVFGYDFAADDEGRNDPDPMDILTHGSHVAGTVAAVGDNDTGITGVAWNVKVMALKVVRPLGYLHDSDIIEAIEYAIMMKERGVNIVAINASYGGTEGCQTDPMRDVIAEAGQAGIAFVASAGNEGIDNDYTPQYPASYDAPNIISVAASDQFDNLTTFSNNGVNSVDLAAPGENILSTIPMEDCSVSIEDTRFAGIPVEYSGYTSGITGILYDCGKGYPQEIPTGVAGNTALVERGSRDENDFLFADKVRNVMDAGAIAVIIYNDVSGVEDTTLGTSGDWIPVIFVSKPDGKNLVKMASYLATVVNGFVSGYEYSQGTSSASPHVSGAVAVLAAAFPQESVSRRIGRILGGAEPVPALSGKLATGGRLNLHNALSRYSAQSMTAVYELLIAQ